MKQHILKTLFNGRLCRRNYIYGTVIFYLLMFLIACILWFILVLTGAFFNVNLRYLFYIVLSPLWILFALSLLIRRHHDLNQGWLYPFLAIVGIIILGIINTSLVSPIGGLYSLYLFLTKGSEEDNKFASSDKSKGFFQIIGLKQKLSI